MPQLSSLCLDRSLGDKGARDGPAFAAHVENLLVTDLQPGIVAILDTFGTHKSAATAKVMQDDVIWFLCPPPCSPDLDIVEMAFSKLTAHLRRIGSRTFTGIAEVCDLYPLENAGNTSRLADVMQVKDGKV